MVTRGHRLNNILKLIQQIVDISKNKTPFERQPKINAIIKQ